MAVHEFNTDKLSIVKYDTEELKNHSPSFPTQIYGDRYIERCNNENEINNENRKTIIEEINKSVQILYYNNELMALNIKMKNYSGNIVEWYLNAICKNMDDSYYSKVYIIDDEIIRTINIINKHYEGTDIEPIKIKKVKALKIKMDKGNELRKLKEICNRRDKYIIHHNLKYAYIVRANAKIKNLIHTFRNYEYEITKLDTLVLDNRNYDEELMSYICGDGIWDSVENLSFLILPHFKEDKTIYKHYFLPFLY